MAGAQRERGTGTSSLQRWNCREGKGNMCATPNLKDVTRYGQAWTESVRGWKLNHVTRCHRIGQSRSEARGHPFVKKQRVIVNLTSILSELHIPKTVHPCVYSSVFPSVHQSCSPLVNMFSSLYRGAPSPLIFLVSFIIFILFCRCVYESM